MPESEVTFFGQRAKVNCDGNCAKAWGIAARPREQLSDDVDDIVYLSDGELGDAPADPETYEGTFAKPLSVSDFPNKWCTRQCERSNISEPDHYDRPLEIKRWDKRVFNQPHKHQH